MKNYSYFGNGHRGAKGIEIWDFGGRGGGGVLVDHIRGIFDRLVLIVILGESVHAFVLKCLVTGKRRVDPTEIWDLGILGEHFGGIFDIVVFKVIPW